MAKVHPQPSSAADASLSETFTVWMKSLVCHGNGCTVYNSKGEVAFRVDNYQQRCSRRAFLMDSTGNLLFSFSRKKLGLFGCWEGFKWVDSDVRMERPCFKVRRNGRIFSRSEPDCCEVSVGEGKKSYRIITGKSKLRITDFSGRILAEATEKHTAEGIGLGDDVLRLVVEEGEDQSLVMALIVVHALIHCKL